MCICKQGLASFGFGLFVCASGLLGILSCGPGSYSVKSSDDSREPNQEAKLTDAAAQNQAASSAELSKVAARNQSASSVGRTEAAEQHQVASSYYVSTAGEDSWSGRLPEANAERNDGPWRTISKAAAVAKAGDTVNIRAGVYQESVRVANNGAWQKPITFQAYGEEEVTISGTRNIRNWALWKSDLNRNDKIYVADATLSLESRNQVFVNGSMVPQARWPNADSSYPWPRWARVAAVTVKQGKAVITGISIPAKNQNYWRNSTIHLLPGHGWQQYESVVMASKEATLETNREIKGVGYEWSDVKKDNEYYLTGNMGELDSEGEWFYNDGKLFLHSTASPEGKVEAKIRSYGFDLGGKRYIRLKRINFFATSIQFDENSYRCNLEQLKMKYLNHDESVAKTNLGLLLRGNEHVVRDSTFSFSSGQMLTFDGDGIRVFNNIFENGNYVPKLQGIGGEGRNNLFSNNTVRHMGRGGVGYIGEDSIIQFNDIYDFQKLTTDGGGLYVRDGGSNATGVGLKVVRYNFIHDAVGPTKHSGHPIQAYYQEAGSSNWLVHHNVMWNVPGYCMQLNHPHSYVFFLHNTCFNSKGKAFLEGNHVYNPWRQNENPPPPISRVMNNIFDSGSLYVTKSVDDRGNYKTPPEFSNVAKLDFSLSEASYRLMNFGMSIPGISRPLSPIGAVDTPAPGWLSRVGHDFSKLPSNSVNSSLPELRFTNKVEDGGFEGENLRDEWFKPNYILGSVDVFRASKSYKDPNVRTGRSSLMIRKKNRSVFQTIDGLEPGKTYQFFAAFSRFENETEVKMKVKLSENKIISQSVPFNDKSDWQVNALEFTTEPGSSSVRISIHIEGDESESIQPLYVDDVGVVLKL